MLLTNFGVMDGRDLLTDLSSVPTKPGVYSRGIAALLSTRFRPSYSAQH